MANSKISTHSLRSILADRDRFSNVAMVIPNNRFDAGIILDVTCLFKEGP